MEVTPPAVPFDAAVILPWASTVIFALVYEPAVTAVFARLIVPVVVIVPPVKPVPVATLVTVPDPVPAPIAVRKSAADNAETVLSALNLGKVIALGLVIVNRLPPRVVAPRLVRPVAATNPVAPPSHLRRSEYAVSQLDCDAVVGMEYPAA